MCHPHQILFLKTTWRVFRGTWVDTDFTTRIDPQLWELARSSLENADPVIERRRIVGKQTTISPAPLVLSDKVDSASVPESLNEAGLPDVLKPSEGDTKKRRVESFDESVDWFQREKSSFAWMTNVSDEREIFEIDVGDPLESEKSFC